MHEDPHAEGARATATLRPTLPNPTSPSVWPTRSWPKNWAPSNVEPPARLPSVRNRCASGKRRASITMNAIVWSATDSAFFPGVVTTGMPRSVAAAVSTLTGPPRAQQTRRSSGAESTRSVTGAPCTTSTSWPLSARATCSGSPANSWMRCSDSLAGSKEPDWSIWRNASSWEPLSRASPSEKTSIGT